MIGTKGKNQDEKRFLATSNFFFLSVEQEIKEKRDKREKIRAHDPLVTDKVLFDQ